MSNPFLTGELVIRTYLKGFFLTAKDGGHHSIDALLSNSSAVQVDERFTFSSGSPTQVTIRTTKGFYLSARGGGSIGGNADDTQTFQTERIAPAPDALFTLEGPAPNGTITIATLDGHFVTALGGGGKSTRAFHTDGTVARSWEQFYILKVGDLGSGHLYAIRPAGTGNIPGQGERISFLTAINGGNRTVHAMTANSPLQPESHFRFLSLPDGSYAFGTSNGFTVVTADNGGGLAHGTPQMDNLITTKPVTQIQDWEKFKIVETSPGLYTIQTVSGFYVAVKNDFTNISTRISFPDQAPSIGYTAHFELLMIA
jgi:hypothetical protein